MVLWNQINAVTRENEKENTSHHNLMYTLSTSTDLRVNFLARVEYYIAEVYSNF